MEYINAKGTKYYLNSQLVNLRGNHEQRIYYFTKDLRGTVLPIMPEGFEVIENKSTGMPILKRV